MSSSNTIQYLKSQCSRYGIMDKLITDNGPQFSSDSFHTFVKDYGFTHETSSPYYAQSNGQAERAVQTVKNLIKKASDPYKALMDYRNTIIEEIGMSPAQLFLGRSLKTDLPTTAPLLGPPCRSNDIKERMKLRKRKQKFFYDRHSGKELRPFDNGEKVVMQKGNTWLPAEVAEKHHNPRSYIVRTDNGKKYRRNRKHLRPTKSQWSNPETEESFRNAEPPQLVEIEPRASTDNPPNDQDHDIQGNDVETHINTEKTSRYGRVIKTPQKYNDYV